MLSKDISMEVERIEVVKDWLEAKSVRNIQVFLGFANFYQQFIQGFSKIVALLTWILKTTRSPNEPAFNRNNGSKSTFYRNDGSRPAFSINNGSRPAFKKNDSNGEYDRFGGNSVEQIRKSRKSKKLSKSQKLAKSGKNLSKCGNSPNFNAKDNGPSFLTPEVKQSLIAYD